MKATRITLGAAMVAVTLMALVQAPGLKRTDLNRQDLSMGNGPKLGFKFVH